MTWNVAQFELLHPAALLALALVPLVMFLGRASLLRLAGWQQRASLTARCVVIAFLVFALCGIQWIRSVRAPYVVFIVDASSSVSPGGRKHVKSFIGEATSSVRQDRWTTVKFPDPGDDMADAVAVAAQSVPSGYVPRLVLLSDGHIQRDSAMVAGSLRTPIDVVPLESITESEAYISQIIAPTSIAAGLPFDVEVVIHASRPTSGVLNFKLGPEEARRDVELNQGMNRFRFRRWLTNDKPAVATASLSDFDDTESENNAMSTVIVPDGRARVLIVESEPDSTARLKAVLTRSGAETKSTTPQEVPKSAETLGRYDLIVLSNVAANLLSGDGQAAIKTYVESGGGLIAVGGDQAFRPQTLADSTLESLLPITGLEAARAAQASLAMVLVIDKSKSMDPIAGRSADKMGLAKQAAKLAVDILQPSDQIGVITFSDNTNWVSDLATLDNKQGLKQNIDAIVAEGGTNMYAALDKAYLALRRADAKLKHVIVLTDGISVPGDFKEIATRMAEEGITVSTVAIGKGVAGAVLTDISDAGRGRHYVCQDPESLPAIVARETRSASEAVASEQPFRAQSIHVPPRLAALELDQAPALGGYAETTPKRRGQLVLTSEAGDPLLAWWRYKKGTVVAFTADAERRWTKPWLQWTNYDDFWLELAQMAMRNKPGDGASVQVITSESDARIIVDMVDGQGASANGWAVSLAGEDGTQPFQQTMPGRYELSIATGSEVVQRTLSIDDRRGKKSVRPIAFVKNYPHELRLQATNRTLLREIADISDGRYEVSASEVFEPDGRTATRVVPLWPYFVAIALLVFLVDVVLRRVDFARWMGGSN